MDPDEMDLAAVPNFDLCVNGPRAEIDRLHRLLEATRTLFHKDTRRVDELSNEAYQAWCTIRDSLSSPPQGGEKDR